jgi:hypothetical protein
MGAFHMRLEAFEELVRSGLTLRRRSSGGTERWWQWARSQMRQEMPMGSKAASR